MINDERTGRCPDLNLGNHCFPTVPGQVDIAINSKRTLLAESDTFNLEERLGLKSFLSEAFGIS